MTGASPISGNLHVKLKKMEKWVVLWDSGYVFSMGPPGSRNQSRCLEIAVKTSLNMYKMRLYPCYWASIQMSGIFPEAPSEKWDPRRLSRGEGSQRMWRWLVTMQSHGLRPILWLLILINSLFWPTAIPKCVLDVVKETFCDETFVMRLRVILVENHAEHDVVRCFG